MLNNVHIHQIYEMTEKQEKEIKQIQTLKINIMLVIF